MRRGGMPTRMPPKAYHLKILTVYVSVFFTFLLVACGHCPSSVYVNVNNKIPIQICRTSEVYAYLQNGDSLQLPRRWDVSSLHSLDSGCIYSIPVDALKGQTLYLKIFSDSLFPGVILDTVPKIEWGMAYGFILQIPDTVSTSGKQKFLKLKNEIDTVELSRSFETMSCPE